MFYKISQQILCARMIPRWPLNNVICIGPFQIGPMEKEALTDGLPPKQPKDLTDFEVKTIQSNTWALAA